MTHTLCPVVPPLSALSLALCHEVLEGGGSHKMKTIISQKETSPLAHFVRNSLPHKSFRFCSPMLLWKPRSGNHHIAKRNFPSCSLCSQFTASQKLLFPNAPLETKIWKPSYRKKKLPLLLTLFAIHCLTKASAFVPQCSSGNQDLETIIFLKMRRYPHMLYY